MEVNTSSETIRSDIRKRKALDHLVETVEVVDDDGSPIDRADLEIEDATTEDADDETDDETDIEQTETTEDPA